MSNGADITPERRKYLRQNRNHRLLVIGLQVSLLLLLIILWETAADLRWIDPFITSQPSKVVKTIVDLHKDGSLYLHIYTTLMETIISFTLGAAGGTLIAISLWWSKTLDEISEPYLVVLNALPKVALGPVLIVWLGNGSTAIIGMALLISIVVTIINLVTGFKEVDPDKVKLLKSFGASRIQVLSKVVLPASLPVMMSTLKVNVGLCLVGVIMGEFLVSRAGLGYLIVYGSQVFKLDMVMSSILILAVIAALMYFLVSFLEYITRRQV
jgi:NitT/TauT family transport system permease protein